MSTHTIHTRESVAQAVEYPTGLTFDAAFDAFSVRLTTLPNSQLRFEIAEGPHARIETVRIATTLIRPGIFLVSWIESNGATVVHVEDFAAGLLHSRATLPNGDFLRMQAPLRIVLPENAP